MNSNKIKDRLERLFSKKQTDEDLKELNNWYDNLQSDQLKRSDSEKAKKAVWKILEGEISLKKEKSFWGSSLKHAAVLLLIAACSWMIWSTFPQKVEQEPLASGSYKNDLGKVSKFLLPDSTVVWLSSGSSLEYAENFPANRQVNLHGEAFFQVKRNTQSPFKIQTGDVTTHVLGTSFNLKSYKSSQVNLQVYSGLVQINHQNSQNSFRLEKDQWIEWNSETGFSRVLSFDSSLPPAWKSGIFRFNNSSIQEIIEELKLWYPVEFEIKGNMRKCLYTGEFQTSSLEQVLEIMSYTLNLHYQIHENKVTIKVNPC